MSLCYYVKENVYPELLSLDLSIMVLETGVYLKNKKFQKAQRREIKCKIKKESENQRKGREKKRIYKWESLKDSKRQAH